MSNAKWKAGLKVNKIIKIDNANKSKRIRDERTQLSLPISS
jgi:hypothetical protein